MRIPSNSLHTCMFPNCRESTGSVRTHFCDEHAAYRSIEVAIFEDEEDDICGFHRPLAAVYVVGSLDLGAVKIGIAGDVLDRMATLQTGFPAKLALYSATYTSRKNAERIERECHTVLKRLGLHLNGEWFSADPNDATELVVRCAKDLGLPVFVSGEYLAMTYMSDYVKIRDIYMVNRVCREIKNGFAREVLDTVKSSGITQS